MSLDTWGLAGLFLGAFLAATILPFSSEALLLLLLSQDYDPWACLLVAWTGNCLGGSVNYYIGRLGNPRWMEKIGFRSGQPEKNRQRIDRYGVYIAFFSWIPVIGDPLLLALGYFRSPQLATLCWMSAGKLLRYVVILWGWLYFTK